MLTLSDEQTCVLPKSTSVVMPFPAVSSPAARPLPIAGPAELGVEIHTPNLPKPNARRVFGILYSGQIKVFGQTISGALYPAQTGNIIIPAGTRISTKKINSSWGNNKQSAGWYGIALIGKRALKISATTKSNDLTIYRPGVEHDEHTIAVGLFTRLSNDPSIALLSLAALAFVMTMQAVTGWIGICKITPHKSSESSDETRYPVGEKVQEQKTQTIAANEQETQAQELKGEKTPVKDAQ